MIYRGNRTVISLQLSKEQNRVGESESDHSAMGI